MKRNYKIGLIVVGLLALGSAMLIVGLRNEVDPLWVMTDVVLDDQIEFVAEVPGKINALYNRIHHLSDSNTKGSTILATPFPLTKSYSAWEQAVDFSSQQKSVLFTSVSGIGSSTFLERMTHFLASGTDNIIKVKCAPNFELLLHQEFIGYFDRGNFVPGKLLDFLRQAKEHPQENFVLFIDDLDKINPESFWGPYLWDILERRGDKTRLGDMEVSFPENVLMLSAISGTGKSLSNQHFRRIGSILPLIPDAGELVSYLHSERHKLSALNDSISIVHLAFLNDRSKVKSFVYSFQKINKIIDDEIGSSFQLGQWSNIRNLYRSEDPIGEMIRTYTNHINGLLPDRNLKPEYFDEVIYAIEHHGKQSGSSPVARFFDMLEDKGYLTEFVVGLSFIFITTFYSLMIYRRRGRRVREQLTKVAGLVRDYEDLRIDFDDALDRMEVIKREIDALTLRRKLNFEEANFLYQFQADKKQEILAAKNGVDHFNMLVNTFMDDNILTLQEYNKLNEFLQKIRTKIGEKSYQANLQFIEQLYKEAGGDET